MESSATKRDIGVILFRVLSIYSFLKATESLSDKFIYFFNPQNYTFMIFIQIIGPAVLLLVWGVIIWYLSPTIASLLSKASDEDKEFGFSLNDVHDMAFSAIGLFILVNTIPDTVNGIGFYYGLISQTRLDRHLAYVSGVAYLGSLVIKLVLGIWLLIGSHGIVKIIRSTRRD